MSKQHVEAICKEFCTDSNINKLMMSYDRIRRDSRYSSWHYVGDEVDEWIYRYRNRVNVNAYMSSLVSTKEKGDIVDKLITYFDTKLERCRTGFVEP